MWKQIKTSFQDRRKIWELLVGLALLAVFSGVAAARWLDPFELLFLDLRYQLRGQRPFPKDIALIGVDEASLDALGRWPWSRDKHAILLDLLHHETFRPAVIGYDMLFENPDPNLPQGDQSLVYQVSKYETRPILSYFFEKVQGSEGIYISRYERHGEKEKILERFALASSGAVPEKLDGADKTSLPFIELARVSDLAFVNAPLDPDGRTRRAQLLVRYGGRIYPSVDLLLVGRFLGGKIEDIRVERNRIVIDAPKGKRVIPITPEGEMLINYYGHSSRIFSIPFVGALEAGKAWMQGNAPPLLKNLKDKIVIVGVTALGLGDRRVTPFHRYETGISLHAQIVSNILEEKFLVRSAPWASYTALVVVGMLVIFATMFLPINRSLPLVLALGVVYFFASHAFFISGVWVDVAVQELTMTAIFIGITSFRYFTALEELKRTQEQLIQSTKMASLGQLSAGIAHEFRNILNAINLHVEYCSNPNTPPEKVTKYLKVVGDIMANANTILKGLLTFARKNESVRKPGNLKKTVEDTLLLVQKAMLTHQIQIKTELEEVDEISYDAGQISQVIMNLMNNGRDAMKDDRESEREITLRVKNDRHGVLLEIGDNGSGIPPQVLKRLFEPFVTSKPAGQGTGLGLSVCHGIIRNHGGEITVTTAPGKGTTWHIFLPKS